MNHIQRVLFVIALLSSSVAFAQLTEDPEDRRDQGKDPLKTQTVDGQPLPFAQRLRFGGGINGFRFGNPFSIGVSPVIAYQATEHLIVGIGGTYNYTRYKPYFNGFNNVGGQTYNQYGGRGFLMYEFIPSILPNLYLHGEIENSTVQQKVDGVAGSYSGQVTAPLIGLTYSQPISRRFGVNLTALYNLNYDANTGLSQYIYGSPLVIRLSFF
ncbi:MULTISPECIES: hypothetical protein [Spirosoma]|uniref:Outer membrane protein beta-barrel domain-containing protein n=1 Tax=Spirosoma liriopis TaxID=2937440 RepID=A0ABT0HU79_9BACT|nr:MULTISPECIES: hypothetical protein [Spirosoma]MCK8495699.1 hypothetical protein [Spirosoma liriopis]UHG91393.1 hypothetical protein LQ777_00485 [Spirosoma oryzicola]